MITTKPANKTPIIWALGVSSASAPNTGQAMTTAKANAQQGAILAICHG